MKLLTLPLDLDIWLSLFNAVDGTALYDTAWIGSFASKDEAFINYANFISQSFPAYASNDHILAQMEEEEDATT